MKSNQAYRYLLACTLLILVASMAFAYGVNVDLGSYTVKNPWINVTYSKPVHLDSRRLTTPDSSQSFTLCQSPKSDATTFVTEYDLYTKTGATDGSCSSGTPQYLSPGQYLLSLQASDQLGQTVLNVVRFNVTGLVISRVAPASGVSANRPPSVTFETRSAAPTIAGVAPDMKLTNSVCKYATTNLNFNAAGMTLVDNGQMLSTHTITLDYRGDIYIICKEDPNAGQEARTTMRLDYDLTPPMLSASVTPKKVTFLTENMGLASIHADTDDKSACTITGAANDPAVPDTTKPQAFMDENLTDYNTYVTSHDIQLAYDPHIVGTSEKNYNYTIICRNLAGRVNTTKVNVTVNFADVVELDVLSPSAITNTRDLDLIVKPIFFADPSRVPLDDCYVNDNGAKDDANKMTRDVIVEGGQFTVFRSHFSFTSDGRKSFDVRCYGEKNASVAYNTTIDSIPPSASSVNASAAICDGNITITFNSTDAGTGVVLYNYTLSDSSGVLAHGGTSQTRLSLDTKQFNLAPDDQLHWEVFATDGAGNQGEVANTDIAVHQGEDEECGLPPFITIRAPNMGFATSVPYTLEIGTARPAFCRYSLIQGLSWTQMSNFTTSDQLDHTKSGLSYNDKTVFIACNETATNMLHKKTIEIGMDATPPKLSVNAIPNPLVDTTSKYVLLTITTDDSTFCSLNDVPISGTIDDQSSYGVTHSTILDFTDITSTDTIIRSYNVSCVNLASLQSSVAFPVVIDLGAKIDIAVLSPQAYTSDDDIVLRIKPNKVASCTWQWPGNATPNDFVADNGTYSVDLGNLVEGDYAPIVTCTSSDDEGATVAHFTVDRTKPVITNVSGPEIVCQGTTAKYYFNLTSVDQNPAISYELTSSNGSNADFQHNTTDALISIDTKGIAAGTYTLSMVATSHANLTSDPATTDFEVKAATDEACTAPADHCMNKKQDAGETGVDCGGTCTKACVACTDNTGCDIGEVCANGFCAPENSTQCVDDTGCDIGQVCSGGVCVAKTEPLASCSDGVQNGDETGIDCGGSCPACVQGCTPACTENETCTSGQCVPNTEPTPTQPKSHLLSYLLIFFGLAIMGGAGYFLYWQNGQKSIRTPLDAAPYTQRPAGVMSPALRQAYNQHKTSRQMALANYAKQMEERNAQRKAALSAFGGQEKNQEPDEKSAKEEKTTQDEYIDISKLKKEDGFDALGKIKK